MERAADCRYKGQGYELRVSVPNGDVTEQTIAVIANNFHEAHEKEFGRAFRDNDVEIVNIRVLGIGRIPDLKWPKVKDGSKNPGEAFKYEKKVVFEAGGSPALLPTKVYERSRLKNGNLLVGPALVEQMDSTVVITPGSEATVDTFGNILIVLHANQRPST